MLIPRRSTRYLKIVSITNKVNWALPPEFQALRRLMEARMIKAGRREYVQVLRLLETFDLGDLHVAVKTALRMGTIGFDAIKHLVLCQVEKQRKHTASTATRAN